MSPNSLRNLLFSCAPGHVDGVPCRNPRVMANREKLEPIREWCVCRTANVASNLGGGISVIGLGVSCVPPISRPCVLASFPKPIYVGPLFSDGPSPGELKRQ